MRHGTRRAFGVTVAIIAVMTSLLLPAASSPSVTGSTNEGLEAEGMGLRRAAEAVGENNKGGLVR